MKGKWKLRSQREESLYIAGVYSKGLGSKWTNEKRVAEDWGL